MRVKAISSFEHGGSRKRGDEFIVSAAIGDQLEAKDLVQIVDREEEAAVVAADETSVVVTPTIKTPRKPRGQ